MRAREDLAAFQCQQRERDPRHEFLAKAFIVRVSSTGNKRNSFKVENLLAVCGVIAANTMAGVRHVSSGTSLVLKLVPESSMGPTSLFIDPLIIKTGTIEQVDVVKLEILINRSEHRVDNDPVALVNIILVRAVQRVIEA